MLLLSGGSFRRLKPKPTLVIVCPGPFLHIVLTWSPFDINLVQKLMMIQTLWLPPQYNSKNFEIMVKVFGAKALRSPSRTSPRKTFCLQLSRALSCSSSKAQTRSPWSVHGPMSGILLPGSVILHSLGSSRMQCTVITHIYIYIK